VVGGQRHTLTASLPRMTRYPSYTRLGEPHDKSWKVAENLAPTDIWSLDRSAHGQSLYRLRYPDPPRVLKLSSIIVVELRKRLESSSFLMRFIYKGFVLFTFSYCVIWYD